MDSFKLEGKDGYVLIDFLELFGFPNEKSYFGGYDVRGKVEIKANNYNVIGELYFSTEEIINFFSSLKKCYNSLNGEAKLLTSEHNLKLSVSFEKNGHTYISGEFVERSDINNKLCFEIIGDQSYLQESIKDLEHIAEKYDENRQRT